ncbi:exocyst subunit [Maudiozyma humilis]|uniref:Exocyst complex component Sec8 n=1 Tax=Maudiozyma humilis TaxID=51915 RepID=A0AAV5S3T5_MAUHU|nr:exocyst subunit [Kazachstania humilis]
MSNLNVNPVQGRRRALSINSIDPDHQHAMDNSLDNLQQDLMLINSQWNKVITEDSNPLKLSLSFLDNTSVGLSHRYQEFTQLKERIGSHLRMVVGEHNQAFNSNVASYSKTISALTDAQDNTSQIKKNLAKANKQITSQKETLQELNNDSLKLTNSIEALSYIEELLQLPERIEERMRREDFKEVQELLERGFVLSNVPSLKALKQLKPVHQQLELQEHVLFQNIIEEIHDIIYSRKGGLSLDTNILETVSISQNGFTSLENYLYNIVNIDLTKQSVDLNAKLKEFMANISVPGFLQTIASSPSSSNSEYIRLYALISLLKDINKLPLALKILVDRSKSEIHNIVITATEKVRATHPTLLKMMSSVSNEFNFGLSIKNMLSLVMRECFWEIFMKFLLVIQKHRSIFEIVSSLQPSSSGSTFKNYYRFDVIWDKLLHEVEQLVSKYIYNPTLSLSTEQHRNIRNAPVLPKRKNQQLFSLQNNVGDNSEMEDYVTDLNTLLKDIFVGFSLPATNNLDSIYIEDESFEQDEPLIPPSVFNMKVLLEPFLLFVQSVSQLIPVSISQNSTPSLTFFSSYMENHFYPRIQLTADYIFSSNVEGLNPHALENMEENQYIFKSAVDFQDIFYNMLYVFNSSNSYRPQMATVILQTLKKFFDYYNGIFASIIGTSNGKRSQNIINSLLNDQELMNDEQNILSGDDSAIFDECRKVFEKCPEFYIRGKGIGEDDTLSSPMLNVVVHFSSTVDWILTWLPFLKSIVDDVDMNSQVNSMNADELRAYWSFFEYMDTDNSDKKMTLRILLDNEKGSEFDGIIAGFKDLRLRLFSLLRFDLRIKAIHNVGQFFEGTSSWALEVGSIELNQDISDLISHMITLENILKHQLADEGKDRIFLGIDVVNNQAFIRGAKSIKVINENGVKKILRNINLLQHTNRNLFSDPSKVSMADATAFYSFIMSGEDILLQEIKERGTSSLTKDNLKDIVRLQFSEEMASQDQRQNDSSKQGNVKPSNRRYNEAIKKIEALDIQESKVASEQT